jgi:hypothetical protein
MAKSEYLQREEAAKKQLGAKGVKKRVKQVPRAARLSVKELTGVNISRKGVSVDPGAAALAAAGFIPFGKSISVAAKALKPAGARISSAAARVANAASKAAPVRSAEAATKSKIASRAMTGVSDAASEAYSNYLKMERRIGSGATDMLVGSEGKYIQRARDTSYQIANAAGEKAIKARDLALRTANRTDTSGAASEIKRRLAALQRAKRNR